jgi:hypothetical protein
MARDSKPASGANIERVSIRPGVSVLAVLRHLNYTPWFALAEFVDNALQSLIENRSALESVYGGNFWLRVSIEIDSSVPGRILVRDNAAGISREPFLGPFGRRRFLPTALGSPNLAWE